MFQRRDDDCLPVCRLGHSDQGVMSLQSFDPIEFGCESAFYIVLDSQATFYWDLELNLFIIFNRM